MSEEKFIEIEETIAASTKQVFTAFSSSIALESWFSDFAEVAFNEKGRLYCWWNVGYYASGIFTRIVEDEYLSFTWSGPDEPHGTLVEISLTTKNDIPEAFAPEVDMTDAKVTTVKIRHSGIGVGSEWSERIKAYKRGWETGLKNLKSVMETGIDKRLYDRPMLGIMPGDLVDDDKAEEIGLPEPYGVILAGTLDGMGAEAAGLMKDDIIISLNRHDLKDYQDFSSSLANCKAGDNVEVKYYRNGERYSVQMTLSRRQIPEAPQTANELGDILAKTYAEMAEERDALFDDVNDGEASVRPSATSWSAKETLVHLLYSERWLHLAISCAVSGQRTGGFANQLELIAAMADSYTLRELLTELKRSEEVTVASFKALPSDFVTDKRKFVGLVNNLGQGFALHSRSHFDQIKEAINVGKESKASE